MALGDTKTPRSDQQDSTPSHSTTRSTQTISELPTLTPAATAMCSVPTEHPGRGDGPRLRISLDYGTVKLASAVLLVTPGHTPTRADIHTVHFSTEDFWAPQQVAWGAEGNFYWGYEVTHAIDDKLLEPGTAISLWKLLLYRNYATLPIADRVQKKLGKRTLDELLTTHLRKILAAVIAWTKSSHVLDDAYDGEDIEDLPMELFLSVPQMWKPPANIRMTTAAKRAGVAHVELIPEPQCALGYYMGNMAHRPKSFDIGDETIVADLGGGTGDFASYAYASAGSEGAKIRLRTVGTAEGDTCGSEFVNENFRKYLRDEAARQFRPGNFAQLCKELGITTAAGISQASEQFEGFKLRFTSPKAGPNHIFLNGAQGAKRSVWSLPLTSSKMVEFFEPVIEKIIGCIKRQRTERTKAIIIPGGFGRSHYLLTRLNKEFPDLEPIGPKSDAMGAYQPIACGALWRYSDIQVRGLPSSCSFGVGRVERYDPDIHPDAIGERPSRASRKAAPNWDIVVADKFDPQERNVYDRWACLLPKGTVKKPGHSVTTETWQQYYVYRDDEEIHQQIYYTELDIEEHEPILAKGRAALLPGAELREGIEPWGGPLIFRLPDLEEMGFERLEQEDEEDDREYEIWYRLKMTCNGTNINVSFQIAKPKSVLYNKRGDFKPSYVDPTEADVHEIMAATHNPVTRTAPS
ncbi:hypothetical protein LTR56_018756 [Elasticomyces elasticus]|nr:hypothetical protein LTR56_018756 [Elasticomyces elasticus]KAK3635983.1 hypothetical protein LTR22_018976 [Elasticomyces elasticus]KAK4911982.1 hypothetical protein LTR49_019544 [Elasticomyces elasticus]KAK5751518.1 hypothetical protein LTS12_018441 [Elasticomyces elasticus]